METFDSAKSAAEKSNLEKVKSDLEEGEKSLVERQKHILLADKSEYGWNTVEEYKQHDLADDSEDEKRIYSTERRARAVLSSRKKKKSSAMAATKIKIFSASRVSFVFKFPTPKSVLPASHCQF